ncbi:MAG: hypothetical protein ACLQU2_31955 [Candidatus Binataceae bacterium]
MPKQQHHRHRLLLTAALLVAAAVAGFSIGKIRTALPEPMNARPGWAVAQDDEEDSGSDEVPPDQVDKYVNVYQAMQRDRTLTVDQAAAQQHLTIQQFRDIEAKIERDGVLRERVRRELLKSAQEKSNALKPKPQSAPSSSSEP